MRSTQEVVDKEQGLVLPLWRVEVTPQDLLAFITGRASPEVKKRTAADLNKQDSYSRKVLKGMASEARTAVAELLREVEEGPEK